MRLATGFLLPFAPTTTHLDRPGPPPTITLNPSVENLTGWVSDEDSPSANWPVWVDDYAQIDCGVSAETALTL